MLALQTINTVSPIHTDAELAQAHLRLDELLAANAFDSTIQDVRATIQDVRDEVEILTALIYYYEQRTRKPNEFEA